MHIYAGRQLAFDAACRRPNRHGLNFAPPYLENSFPAGLRSRPYLMRGGRDGISLIGGTGQRRLIEPSVAGWGGNRILESAR